MDTDDQPLNQQPQDTDDTSFDDAFDEYAGGGGASAHDTDRDFEAGDQEYDESESGAEGDRQADDQQDGDNSGEGGSGDGDEMTPRERDLQAQLERLRHSEASQRGRLGAYQRQINELRQKQGVGQQASAGDQSSQSAKHGGEDNQGDEQQRQEAAEAMGADDWQTFKEDFPDMAKALEARLEKDRQERGQLEQRLAQYEPALQSIQQQAQEQHLQVQKDALSARHPDWEEVVAAPAFAEWLNQQPQSLQGLVESDDAAEAAALLDMYRAQSGAAGEADSRIGTPDKRQDRLAAAQSPQRRGRPRQGQVADDFDAAFDHYAAKHAAR